MGQNHSWPMRLAHTRESFTGFETSNILTPDGFAKVWTGIAVAFTETSHSSDNSMLGSVHYLSPEQARGSVAFRVISMLEDYLLWKYWRDISLMMGIVRLIALSISEARFRPSLLKTYLSLRLWKCCHQGQLLRSCQTVISHFRNVCGLVN